SKSTRTFTRPTLLTAKVSGSLREPELRLAVAHSREAQCAHRRDAPPSQIDLAAAQREPGGRRGRVVVVVEAFAHAQQREQTAVRARVLVRTPAVDMTDRVHRAVD